MVTMAITSRYNSLYLALWVALCLLFDRSTSNNNNKNGAAILVEAFNPRGGQQQQQSSLYKIISSSPAASARVQYQQQHHHQRRRAASSLSSPTLSTTPKISSSRLYAVVPVLDRWKILPNGSLVGTVSGHPSIDDGDVITTSPIEDPYSAKTQRIVTTASGSQYKLLIPLNSQRGTAPAPTADQLLNGRSNNSVLNGANAASSSSVNNGSSEKIRTGPEWRDAVLNYKLNSSTVGLEEEYLLAGKPTRSTSGKSNIWEAYRSNDYGLPNGEPPVCVKVSSNLEAVSREYDNYRKLTNFMGKQTRGQFVDCVEFFPVAGYDKKLRSQCALVLEMGARDLKSFLDSRGKLEGEELRDACISAAQCVQALHQVGLVWTDLKTENFVVMGDGEVKGIDLESAMPVGDNPVDYSPEACPPEFAEAFLSGDGPYFELETSYDIWSLGMMMLELATGGGYFDGKNPAQITKILRDMSLYEETLPNIDTYAFDIDEKLKDLIARCLSTDPKKRPSSAQVLLHPYFLTGPLSWLGGLVN